MSNESTTSSKFDYTVDPFEEDFTGRLSWPILGRRILTTASLHANCHGFGMKQLLPQNKGWVLSRMIIELEDMPCVDNLYSIETWIRKVYRTFTDRCFSILRPDGTPYGYAYTIWAMIDTKTRQPINLEKLPDGGFSNFADEEKVCKVTPFSRIRVKADEPVRILKTHYSDIDINDHVNSIRYIEHMLDLFPKEKYKEHPVYRIEIAYHEESYACDSLYFYKQQIDEKTFNIEIRKNVNEQEAGNSGEVVCGCRISFK